MVDLIILLFFRGTSREVQLTYPKQIVLRDSRRQRPDAAQVEGACGLCHDGVRWKRPHTRAERA